MYSFRKKIKGFTLVESIIAIGMAAGLIILVMKISSVIRGDVAKGTVDLQNLQDARLVINSLRRDFTCAMPNYDFSDTQEAIDAVRNNPVLYTETYNDGSKKSKPIIIHKYHLNFVKPVYDSGGNLTREEIYYVFDNVNKTLIRHSSVSGDKHFKGMDSIEFGLYYHPLESDVPMLLVSMIIRTTEGGETKSLPLTTTICSSIVNKDIVNLDWNSYKKN
ncbi:MAG: type II secretion system protein [Candidatus Riflebacteria bacterium]|nr:type II secretion system protein [Candidatus Riflebacteria bacterium]